MNKSTLGEMPQSINDRNWTAVQQTLEMQSNKIAAQGQRIDGLQAALTGMMSKLAAIEKDAILTRLAAMGRGPTQG